MKKIYLIFLLLSLKGTLFSQTDYNSTFRNNGIQHPSPTSWEFQKYLGYPVSLATGIPEITIPLFEMKVDNFTIPFQLQYHSSGIKVEQNAGIIGYGWTLNPGLRITRIIMGKADEECLVENVPLADTMKNNIKNLVEYARPLLDPMERGSDGEYDHFSIYLPNYNGNFIFQRKTNGELEVLTIPSSPLKVTPKINKYKEIWGFDVKDENGIIYEFGARTDDNLLGLDERYLECKDINKRKLFAWVLRKITLPGTSNNIIEFTYVDGNPYQQKIHSDKYILEYLKPIWFEYNRVPVMYKEYGGGSVNFGNSGSSFTYRDDLTYNNNDCFSTFIKSIKFPNGKINFEYKTEIHDFYLSSIAYLNNNLSLVKSIEMERENQQLKSLKISGEGKYGFEYDKQNFEIRYDQDYWGYYNNAKNNTVTLIPKSVYDYGVNREPNEMAMQAKILKEIIYPTGGRTKFIYESNKYNGGTLTNPILKVGPGLRIKEMHIYDNPQETSIIKKYKYGKNECGYGPMVHYPEIEDFRKSKILFHSFSNIIGSGTSATIVRGRSHCQRIELLPQPTYSFYLGTNNLIWYDEVAVYEDNGKIINYFEYISDHFISSREMSFYKTILSLISNTPYLIKKKIYKKDGKNYSLIKEIENKYSTHSDKKIRGLIVEPLAYASESDNMNDYYNSTWLNFVPNTTDPDDYFHGFTREQAFRAENYTIHTGKQQLTQYTEHEYTQNGTISKVIQYNYDFNQPYNLISQTQSNSDNTSFSIRNYYPYENVTGISTIIRNLLLNNNRVSTVIQTEVKNGNTLVHTEQTHFKDYTNRVIVPEKVLTKEGDGEFKTAVTYDLYNSNGRLIQYTTREGVPTSIIWGYNYQYPIAKIIGATYTEVKTALGKTNDSNDLAYMQALTDNLLVNEFTKLRNYFSGNNNVQVLTYIYKPLIGITSETDANGLTTSYEYDDSGRLIKITDNDGNILKQYQYHFKNQ